jgi:protein ImuB
MARIACLMVPDLPIAALLRIDPDLKGTSLAVTEDRSPRSPVVALSSEAKATGLRLGMTAVQVRAACPDVIVRPHSITAVRAAGHALADVAETVSPRVELDETGRVFLDITASTGLCASENELATILAARAGRQGLTAHVGVGSSKSVAGLAARLGRGVCVIPSGEERAYLTPLPIGTLDPDPALAAVLASWGIRLIGDLLRVPAGELGHRLGPAGARLIQRARGEDDAPFCNRQRPDSFVEAIDLDYAVDQIEPLLFLLHRLVDRVAGRLALQGFACTALAIDLHLANGGRDARQITVAAPTSEGRLLLTVVRAHLECQPLAHGVIAVTLSATPECSRPIQLNFFQSAGPSPTALATTLARLAALCGSERIGTAALVDSHRPDSIAMTVFPQKASPSPPSLSSSARVALRAFRPAVPLEVFENAGRPDYVRGRGFGGRVVHLAGPWRFRGEWWTTDPYAREYYDIELSDGGVYRIYHDFLMRRWLADGAYD